MCLTMTRTFYCPACARSGRPAKGNLFCLFTGTHQVLEVHRSFYQGIAGFTPHFIKTEGNEIEVCCTMDGCGVEIIQKPDDNTFIVEVKKWRSVLMLKNDKDALVHFTNTGYELNRVSRH